MKHKLFTLLLAVAASVGTMFAWDYEQVPIGDLYYNLDATNQMAEVAINSSASGEIIIPASVEYNSVTYSVTSIGSVAFSSCTGLTSIEIPNSVTSIGSYAFHGCTGLTSVTIGNSVTSIGRSAFMECRGLTSVTIPNSVTSIGSFVFEGCSGLTSVTIPNSVTSIERGAFSGCSGLISIEIPNSVTSIGKSAFNGCSGLTSIEIPNSVTSIGTDAFYGCTGLTSVIVENGNTVYDSRNNCNAIIETATNTLIAGCMNTIIPNSVTSIGYSAFSGCSSLTSVTIPNSVTSIGEWAFGGCSGLTSVTIPNSVTSIGYKAFSGCSSLTSVTIPNSVTSIGDGAFSGCDGLTSIIVENGNTVYDSRDNCNAIIETATNTLIAGYKNTTIPNNVTSIGEYAFWECTGLTSVTIGNSVTSIESWAFSNCNNLTSIEIPNSVTSIGKCAFDDCIGLTSVTIPNSVTSIGNYAFRDCSSLTSVTNYASIPQSIIANVFDYVNKSTCTLYVPAESVDAYKAADVWKGFGKIEAIDETPSPCITASGTCGAQGDNLTWTLTCDSVLTISGTGAMAEYTSIELVPWLVVYHEAIKSVIIGEEVINIGNYAFSGCSGLTSVTIGNSVTSIGKSAFRYCTSLTSVTMPNSVTSIGESAFSRCSSLISVTISDSVTNIGNGAFYECIGLTSVEIPNSVTNIEDLAFSSCINLASVTIPNSVTGIGENAFYRCTGLTSIIVENGNTVYDSRNNCNAIVETATNTLILGCKNTTIPNSVTLIGNSAFSNCDGLTSITIPDSVTGIGDYAFAYSSDFTFVTIPANVTSIGNCAFAYCDGLTSFTNKTTKPQVINAHVFSGVNKSTCTLYVPAESVEAYKAADVWKDFVNILPIEGNQPVEPTEGEFNILYVGQDGDSISSEEITLHLPVAPTIEGFIFLKWQVVVGDLIDQIVIQAVYIVEEPTSAPAVYTNPANPAQKLIRNGNVYILTDDKTYTITGQAVR